MARLVVSEFVTLDGVMEDPGGAEDFEHGGWSFKFGDPKGYEFKLQEVLASDVLLLGRVTYEGFAAAWPERGGDGGFADKMNGMRKVVASTTLEAPAWNNTTVIRDDIPAEVARLKARNGGDILVAGSGTLVHTLMDHGLVDEYRLMVHPVVLGSGRRLFREGGDVATLRLAEATPLDSGAIILIYTPGE